MSMDYAIGFYRYYDKLMKTPQFLKYRHLRDDKKVVNFDDIRGYTYFFDKDIMKDRVALKDLECAFNYELRGFKCKFVKKGRKMHLLYFDPNKYTYNRKGKPVLKRTKLQDETNCNIIL